MNDRELIELLRHQPPDQLSAEEIALLRARIVDSPAVRDALLDQLRIDHYLHDSIGGVQVSVDKIIAAAAAGGGLAAKPLTRWLAWGFGAVVAIVGTTLLLGPRVGLFKQFALPVVAARPVDAASQRPVAIEDPPSDIASPAANAPPTNGGVPEIVPLPVGNSSAWELDDESSPSDAQFAGAAEESTLAAAVSPLDTEERAGPLDPTGTMPGDGPSNSPDFVFESNPDIAAALDDFEAALANAAYIDACRALTFLDARAAGSLVPDRRDPQLMTPLHAMVRRAFDQHPLLASTMRQQFADQGQSLVRQAIDAGDIERLRAATVQFHGTSAAAEAHAWLGDHALAGGDFTLAASEFRDALAYTGDTDPARLNARLRLANALLGQDVGAPVQAAVVLGDRRLAAGEFESLVKELTTQSAITTTTRKLTATSQVIAPPPGRYELRSWANLDQPRQWPNATITGELMLATDGSGVEAFDLATGVRRWSARLSGTALANAVSAACKATMVVADDHIFLRVQSATGGELVCLRLADGAVVWRSLPDVGVVGDPQLLEGRLVALIAVAVGAATRELCWAGFDRQSGAVVVQRPVLRLHANTDRPLECRTLAIGDRLVAVLPLGFLCCDSSGELQWLRHQSGRNGESDSAEGHANALSMLVHDDAVYGLNPSGPAVECLDLANGLVLWRREVPGATMLAGMDGSRLIVRADASVVSIETADGSIAWSHASACPKGAWIDETGGRILVLSSSGDDSAASHRLSWLDAATGTVAEETSVTNWPINGTLIGDASRNWIISSAENAAPGEILELVRDGDAP